MKQHSQNKTCDKWNAHKRTANSQQPTQRTPHQYSAVHRPIFNIRFSAHSCTTFMCQMWTLLPFISCNLNISDIRIFLSTSADSASLRLSEMMAAGVVFAISYMFACHRTCNAYEAHGHIQFVAWSKLKAANQIPFTWETHNVCRFAEYSTIDIHHKHVVVVLDTKDEFLSIWSRTFEFFRWA